MRYRMQLVATGFLLAWSQVNFAQSFEEHRIEAPGPLIQPAQTADLLPGGGQELILFTQSNNARQLHIYQWQGDSFSQTAHVAIAPEYFSYDISEPDDQGAQSLFFLAADSLAQLVVNGASAALEQRAAVRSLVREAQPTFIYRDAFLQPLHGNNQSAAVIADFDQLHVITHLGTAQQRQHTLPIGPQIIMDNRGARYTPAPIFAADINGDHRQDLIRPHEGQLHPFLQQEDGTFSAGAPLAIAPDISGVDWWYKRDINGQELDQSNLTYRKLERLQDINNDGRPDMIVRYTRSQGVLDRVNDYEIYLGQAASSAEPGAPVQFHRLPDSTIKAEGTLTGLNIIDMHGDQRPEILLSRFNIGITQIIGALLSGSIDQQVYLFAQDEQGHFGAKPAAKEQVALKFSLTSGRSGSAITLLADITGDDVQDLVLSKSGHTLEIYPGNRTEKLIAKKPLAYKTTLPEDGSHVRAADLNNDAKADLVLGYGKLDSPELSNTILLLITK